MVRALLSIGFLAVCVGCRTPALFDRDAPSVYSPSYQLNIFGEGNYLTYEHAFTDAQAEFVHKNAEKQCGHKKQVAVKASGTCSLTRCITNYYCMAPADAAAYETPAKK